MLIVSRVFPAHLDALYEMLSFIKNHAKSIGFQSASLSQIELASEEALVNVISYGYIENKGEIEIELIEHRPRDENDAPGIQIVIKDRGIPYNPLESTKESSDSMAILGGYGVFFILKTMDEVKYKRENNSNILILIKYL